MTYVMLNILNAGLLVDFYATLINVIRFGLSDAFSVSQVFSVCRHTIPEECLLVRRTMAHAMTFHCGLVTVDVRLV